MKTIIATIAVAIAAGAAGAWAWNRYKKKGCACADGSKNKTGAAAPPIPGANTSSGEIKATTTPPIWVPPASMVGSSDASVLSATGGRKRGADGWGW